MDPAYFASAVADIDDTDHADPPSIINAENDDVEVQIEADEVRR